MNALKEAIDYLSYGMKEGFIDDSITDGLTNEQIIELATELQERGEMAYEAWKERDV